MSKATSIFHRRQTTTLLSRLKERRRLIQVVAGPRQVGKSTLVKQVADRLDCPVRIVSADEPALRGTMWIAQQWEAARLDADSSEVAVLVLDEIQKIPQWSETVKRLWDEDTRAERPLHVVILGSAPLLVQHGLSESLAGRFETVTLPHWSYHEMREAFGWTVDEYIFHGGYPGSASYIHEPERWERYILQSLIETSISRDVLLLTRVDKPALLRRFFDLACRYSGQILSFTKMLGQLQDAGNTVTLAHYLDLLNGAGMVCGLPKYAGDVARSRGSSPKLQVYNNALMSAGKHATLQTARNDPEYWGRLIESTIGTHLVNASLVEPLSIYYWNKGNAEVDYVIRHRGRITAIEVKSGRTPARHPGIELFVKEFSPNRTLLVGGDGISVEEFLLHPVVHWCA